MPRETYVWDDVAMRLVPKADYHARRPLPQRSGLPRPYIVSDVMDPTLHPITGKHMDSKASFRAVTKAHGCIEVGDEKPSATAAEPDRSLKTDIARAFAEHGA